MKLLTVFCIFAIAIGANADIDTDGYTNKQIFLRIIECAQKVIVKGLPEIGVPPHDPLRISKNFTYTLDLGSYSIEVGVENMYMEGIPWWEVRQMDDVSEKEENPVFDYNIYWKMMSFEGKWKFVITETKTGNKMVDNGGDIGFELDHLTFAGRYNFSKPEDDKEVGFNDLTLHLHTEESEVHFDNLGLISSGIRLLGGPALTKIFNMDLLTDILGPGIRDKFNKDWVGKPERIVALITHCDD
ncbi:uncharacterized protein LOC108905822 [Anoplophora glabripennis]|uniref:uncharacterized protein LOC108905822 n=1 Tax=Anoplophora glabripennis TaxID=217634 RepID=UPI000874B382|nr:uncharacterized protein LOC108905822 [Anoplophora glabripennis]